MTHLIDYHSCVLIAAAAALVFAAAKDFRHYLIPNECSLLLLALYPLHAFFHPVDLTGAVFVASITFVVGYGLYALGRFGAGDVKLLSVMALWAGPVLIGELLIVMALAGGALAIAYVTRLKLIMAFAFDALGDQAARDSVMSEKLPYGVAIATGGGAVLIALW